MVRTDWKCCDWRFRKVDWTGKKVKLKRFNIDNRIVETSDDFIKRFEETFDDGNEYYFIIGMDNALTIDTWILYPEILNLLKFIVIERI